jgi:hypothetical protein
MSKAEYNPPIGLLNKWQIAERYGDYKGLFSTDPSLEVIFDIIEQGSYFFSNGLGTFTRGSVGSYSDSNGEIKIAAIDQPRFEHDRNTFLNLGLLLEQEKTNHFTYSNDFTNAAWVKNGATITPNYAIGPDGLMSATRIQFPASAWFMYQLFARTLGENFTHSFYIKSNGNDKDSFRLYGDSSSQDIEATDEWERYTLSTVASTTGSSDYGLRSNSTNDEVDILIAFSQLEKATFASTYIPTSSTAVVRELDGASIEGAEFTNFYDQTKGTYFVRFNKENISAVGEILNFSDGTANEQILLSRKANNEISLVVVDGGVEQANLSTSVDEGVVSLAFGIEENNLILAINGELIGTDVNLIMPTVDRLEFGKNFNSTIQRFVSFDVFLAQLDILKLSENS